MTDNDSANEAQAAPADKSRALRRRTAFSRATLTYLLHRAGGRIDFTEADYQAVVSRYGGASQMDIHFDLVREQGQPDRIVAQLQRKPPANPESPSR